MSLHSFSSLICLDLGFRNNINNEYDKNSSTLCINNERSVFSIGYSDYNSHGHENNKIFPIKQIQGLINIKMIDCGYFHSVCINYNGDIYSFGKNNYGQLGINKDEFELPQTHIPQKIILPSIRHFSCGNYFTICITEDNILYSFGINATGQLCLGNYNKVYNSPQLIPDLNNIEYIVSGGNYSICKTYNNEFYSWGSNFYGELGQGNNDSCNTPIQCFNWPKNIISIRCGANHSLLLTEEGQIYSFGRNFYGQLGINDKNIQKILKPILIKDIPEIKRIECGHDHSICIDIENNLWIFGSNFNGQLGLGENANKIIIKPMTHPTLSNISDISSGGSHTFIKTIDNKIYSFGNNQYSQLGIQTSESHQLTPIQVFKDNEDIWCSTIGKSKAKSARK